MGAESPVHATVDVAGHSTSEVSRVVEAVMGEDGSYRSAAVGPDAMQFVRTYRPTWALIAGLLGLVLFGLGILFLLVRRTESCTMTIVNGPTGAVLTVTGRLDPTRLQRIRAELASGRVAPDSPRTPAAPSVRPAMSPDPTASIQRRAEVVSPDAGPAVSVATPASTPGDVDLTVARPAATTGRPHEPSSGFSLCLSDGRTIPLEGTTLLGRDPARRPVDGDRASLVPVADPGLRVSKTHLAVRVEGDSVVVEDLHSTNGTGITDPTGRRISLVAGCPERIAPGSSVHLGDLRIEVRVGG